MQNTNLMAVLFVGAALVANTLIATPVQASAQGDYMTRLAAQILANQGAPGYQSYQDQQTQNAYQALTNEGLYGNPYGPAEPSPYPYPSPSYQQRHNRWHHW